jgi:hypothetical protein
MMVFFSFFAETPRSSGVSLAGKIVEIGMELAIPLPPRQSYVSDVNVVVASVIESKSTASKVCQRGVTERRQRNARGHQDRMRRCA